jgi:acyl-coenzyme A synthetase/AMP-(fatty) acid ligase
VVADDGAVLAGPGAGELWVSTPFQTPGYLNAPGSLNASSAAGRFAQHPQDGEDERIYFRTGDLVRQDGDGTVTLIGPNDFQVKVRGVAVNLQEIERIILDHDAVAEAAVVAVADELAGNRLHAQARRTPGAQLNGLSLREHCAARMPRAAIPSTLLITDEPLPRTPTGKIDRQAII